MKIGIYNTYLEGKGWGGGERYTLSIAAHWSKIHTVSCFVQDPALLAQAAQKFALDVSRVTCVPNIFQHGSLASKLMQTAKYDVLFVLTDGSVPTSFAKHNIFHIQAPYQDISVQRLMLSRYNTIVVNSEFTKNNLPSTIATRSRVIYPPVDTTSCVVGQKEQYIISVGRLHELKKFDVLIDAMKDLSERSTAHGWKLILAGGLRQEDQQYLDLLKKKSQDLPIEILPNVSHDELTRLYSSASLYWHAAGYGETDPVKMEHFGISVVEAMASGAIPLAVGRGGLPEIIHDGQDGFLWSTIPELVTQTETCIKTFGDLGDIQRAATLSAERFSIEKFNTQIDTLLAF